MACLELLGRERRTEIRIRLAQNPEHLFFQSGVHPVIARSVTPLGDQPDRTFAPVAHGQPAHLSCGESEPLGGANRLQISIHNGLNTLQSIQLLHAHCHPGQLPHHRSPRPETGPKDRQLSPARRTFELSQNRTSLLGPYISSAYNVYYVKSPVYLGPEKSRHTRRASRVHSQGAPS